MNEIRYNLFRSLSLIEYAEQIFLPKEEYARVMHEFNSRMSEEDRKHRIVTKAIGDYWNIVKQMDTLFNNIFMERQNYSCLSM